MTTPAEEAAAILVRVLEAMCRANGKTLKARTRDDIARACELLANPREELDDLLLTMPVTPGVTPHDAPRVTPSERTKVAFERDEADIPHWRQRLRNDGQ